MQQLLTNQTWCGNMTCWANDIAFARALMQGKTYEEHLVRGYLAPYIRNAKTIVDVGAHVGMHSVAYAYLNPQSAVYAFEPQRHLYFVLNKNVTDNDDGRRGRVITQNVAVGHRAGEARMSLRVEDCGIPSAPVEYGTSNGFNLGGLALGRDGEVVQMIRLDDANLPGCDFMKIDAEGFEPLVIEGAMDTIKKHHPIIFYEHNDKTITPAMREYFGLGNDVIPSVETRLLALGYRIEALPDDNYIAFPPN